MPDGRSQEELFALVSQLNERERDVAVEDARLSRS
jgi:hypothetical protein